MNKILPLSRVLALLASLAMVTVYFVPFWQILMWAPQYPEGLTMRFWTNKITGDVEIINGLNHYIGMAHIKVEMFPEFKIMPWLVAVIIALGLLTVLTGRKWLLWIFLASMILTAVVGLGDFYRWGYEYGHNLDPTAPIKVPGMSYQPPLLGSKRLLNFLAYSGPDTGGWFMAAAGVFAALAIAYEKIKNKPKKAS